MPTGKRHHKKGLDSGRQTLPPSPPNTQQQPERNTERTANEDERGPSTRPSGQQVRKLNPSHDTKGRSWGRAFHRQYYLHWIFIAMAALLSVICYHHGGVVHDFIKELCEQPWKFLTREQYYWSDGWPWGDSIDRRSNLSLEEFRRVYDGKRPVLITDVLQHWGAKRWSRDFFLMQYGHHRVVMKAVEGKLSQAESFALPLEKFIEHLYEGSPHRWTYVEDELFIPSRPELKKDISACRYLEEDFFKLFPKEIRPWDAMFLWGTRYSRSSLHIDPYNWTGTNAVLKGLKKWKLYPPGQDEYLYVLPDRMSGFPLKSYKYNSPIDAFDPDFKKYPKFAKARAIEFTQHPGELLIIPTGWFHQAYNAIETMAVSGQVMNTANYRYVLEEIIKAGNLNMAMFPDNYEDMTPAEQVRAAVALIPQSILDKGRRVTEDALNQIRRNPHEHT